uniref:Uncharacterized protein n=1 Tax=Candidatus Kentrum sp. TUN TaxID=2126343 RepID=A0A451AAZ2_9GAMM|nr:MAG: hypothetical protein BECKTUN1418F_GA0071002_11882 [Candidatus Kentron sp. TUN]VFK63195.1 MAG: hypothetical protein BECKTUN1418D_GA0071000_12022 [Candidatus Kentron sp. TUN]VFK68456.1 MAG: hypothetical protein BECKTUN1418E_GA0071001_11842 [Candidatus Kentron sp. TUN]
MSNRYILTIAALGRFPELKVDKDRYERLKASKPILSHALAIEEKYEILISNFQELERDAINISVSEMVRNHIEYKDFFDVQLTLNIRLVNLLTAIRLYTDQLSSHICACLSSKDDTKAEIKKLFATEYDSSFDYRFMEALRNYVQHSGIPVHKISTGGEWTDINDGLLEYSIYFGTKREKLLLDDGFKKQVLEEMPEEVNLRSASRSYVEAISRIHKHAREMLDKVVKSSRLEIERAIQDYTEAYKEEPLGLYAYEYHGKQKIDEVSILLKWDDIRQELVRRNSELIKLRKRYVTSE